MTQALHDLIVAAARIDNALVLLVIALIALVAGVLSAPAYDGAPRVIALRTFQVLSVGELASGVSQMLDTGTPFGMAHLAYLVEWATFAAAYALGMGLHRVLWHAMRSRP